MVTANSTLPLPLTVYSEVSLPLRFSCSPNEQRLSWSRREIISCERFSGSNCSWRTFVSGRTSLRSGSLAGLLGPGRGRRPYGSWQRCSGSGLASVNRRGLVLGSIPVTWIAAALVGTVATGALAMAAMADQGGRQQAMLATRKGMELFSQGDVKGSLEKFDEALELDPQSMPYLWQRGLSLYYEDRFEEGAKQFRDDVAVNPNDTEEAIWCFLCEAQYLGVEEARRRFLVANRKATPPGFFPHSCNLEKLLCLLVCPHVGKRQVGPDRRAIMKEIYNLFRFGGSMEKLLEAVNSTDGADFFYANLYAGLYHEAYKRQDASKDAILAAVHSSYGTRSGDYMTVLARVHAKCRG